MSLILLFIMIHQVPMSLILLFIMIHQVPMGLILLFIMIHQVPMSLILLFIMIHQVPMSLILIGEYWSCGWNVGFWIQRLTVRTLASVCCVLEQDTLSAVDSAVK